MYRAIKAFIISKIKGRIHDLIKVVYSVYIYIIPDKLSQYIHYPAQLYYYMKWKMEYIIKKA